METIGYSRDGLVCSLHISFGVHNCVVSKFFVFESPLLDSRDNFVLVARFWAHQVWLVALMGRLLPYCIIRSFWCVMCGKFINFCIGVCLICLLWHWSCVFWCECLGTVVYCSLFILWIWYMSAVYWDYCEMNGYLILVNLQIWSSHRGNASACSRWFWRCEQIFFLLPCKVYLVADS